MQLSRGGVSAAALRDASEAELVQAVLDGHRDAARIIVERHRPTVRRCLRTSLEGAELDDGVQMVFARCFEVLPRLRDPSSLRSFIIGIALRLGAMERRRRRARWREMLSSTGELPEVGCTDDRLSTQEVAARTRALLERLAPEARRVLELRLLWEQELAEVAEAMGISLATTKRHLSRLTARMRAMAAHEPALAEYIRDECSIRPEASPRRRGRRVTA